MTAQTKSSDSVSALQAENARLRSELQTVLAWFDRADASEARDNDDACNYLNGRGWKDAAAIARNIRAALQPEPK